MSTTYYTQEVEIAGEKIRAKYFESNYSFHPYDETKLSKLWDKITWPFYVIRNKIREIRREIRYCIQRMFKDYDNVDTFGLCDKFIERYTKILKEYKENMHGCPGTMTEDEWDEILDQMLFHLYYMDEDKVDKELMKDVPKSWIVTCETIYPIMEHHKNEFFKLFSEHFYDLWD